MKTFKEFMNECNLYEMRKEDKVKGKQKTPLRVLHTRTYREPGPWKKTVAGWTRSTGKEVTDTRMVGNPTVSAGRYRQGGSGGNMYGYKRHAHGGADNWTPAGSARGVKKVKGEKKPEIGHTTPAEKVAARRVNRDYSSRRYYGNSI